MDLVLQGRRKKGCRAKVQSVNRVNKCVMSGDAIAGTNSYTVDEYKIQWDVKTYNDEDDTSRIDGDRRIDGRRGFGDMEGMF